MSDYAYNEAIETEVAKDFPKEVEPHIEKRLMRNWPDREALEEQCKTIKAVREDTQDQLDAIKDDMEAAEKAMADAVKAFEEWQKPKLAMEEARARLEQVKERQTQTQRTAGKLAYELENKETDLDNVRTGHQHFYSQELKKMCRLVNGKAVPVAQEKEPHMYNSALGGYVTQRHQTLHQYDPLVGPQKGN